MRIMTTNTNNTALCIKGIGQSLINRAEDIANDTKVRSITIHAELKPREVVTINITKEYYADNYNVSLEEMNELKKGK